MNKYLAFGTTFAVGIGVGLYLPSVFPVFSNTFNVNHDDFAKKIECTSLETGIKAELNQRYYSQYDAEKIDKLDVFFSPKKNSCLYAYEAIRASCGVNYGCRNNTDYDLNIEAGIEDALTGERSFFKSVPAGYQVAAERDALNQQEAQLQAK